MQKFIVIEGIDGSGKTTQVKELKKYYENLGKKVLVLDYPRYNEEIAIGVKRYLNGDYGQLDNVTIYQASTLYAMDRLDNHLHNLKNIWNDYDIILGNRYTTSNLIHQGGRLLKILSEKGYLEDEIIEKKTMFEFKSWLDSLEYKYLSLPEPTSVVFLDIAENVSMNNIENRGNKKDLHENSNHLKWAYKSAKFWTNNLKNWTKINCLDKNNKQMVPVKIITEKIIKIIN